MPSSAGLALAAPQQVVPSDELLFIFNKTSPRILLLFIFLENSFLIMA
jgi:hypothetical protein